MKGFGPWSMAACVAAAVLGVLAWGALAGPRRHERAGSTSDSDEVLRASGGLMPKELSGVQLHMSLAALQKSRPQVARNQRADEPPLLVFDEALPSGVHALYLFSASDARLERVQVATELAGDDAIAPRVQAMQDRYGAPSGIWDCLQREGQLPMRRFTWTRGIVGVMDAYLLLRERVLATQIIAPTSFVLQSLGKAHCVSTPPERLTRFPVVDPAQAKSLAP